MVGMPQLVRIIFPGGTRNYTKFRNYLVLNKFVKKNQKNKQKVCLSLNLKLFVKVKKVTFLHLREYFLGKNINHLQSGT